MASLGALSPYALSPYDYIDIAYGVICVGIDLAILGSMFVNINRLWAARGSLDFYFHFLAWSALWQLPASLIYALLYALI